MRKKQILTALVIASAVTLAGCSSSKKETEAPAPETQAAVTAESEEAAAETQAATVAETEAAAAVVETEAEAVETEAAVVETEAAPVVETEAEAVETEAAVVETEVAVVETEAEAVETEAAVVETEAAVVETEAEAVETEAAVAETEAEAVETEAAVVETEAAPVVETEAEAVETEAAVVETEAAVAETEAEAVETEEDLEIVLSETETEFYADAMDDETEYDYLETESEYDFYFDEDETETEPVIIPRPEYDVNDYLTIEDDEYLNMTVQVAPARTVSEEEIDAEISDSFYYLEEYDDLIIKKTEGTVAEGDNVNIDYVGTKDGEAFEGGTAEAYDLVIGSGSFIEGFEEGLIGKEIGSTVDLNLTFPEDYGVEDLNGADVVFTVTINYVSEIPEITDEIAEKLSDGEYTTVEDYRESIRAEQQTYYDDEYKDSVTSAVMSKLFETYQVEDYPQENVDYNVNMILSQYIEPYASMYGMSTEDFVEAAYGMTYDEFYEAQMVPAAQQMLSQEIILGAIAEKEGITMTDEELQERLQGYADEYGVEIEDITYGQDMGYIRVNELDQKVMTWLSENVKVELTTETEAEELLPVETEAEMTAAETEAEVVETETEA